MDPEQCTRICKENNNWLYAMPYSDGTCYCSGDLPNGELEVDEGDDGECDLSCSGHPNQACGGDGEDNVPRVGFWRNPLDSARTVIVLSSFILIIWPVVKSLAIAKMTSEIMICIHEGYTLERIMGVW